MEYSKVQFMVKEVVGPCGNYAQLLPILVKFLLGFLPQKNLPLISVMIQQPSTTTKTLRLIIRRVLDIVIKIKSCNIFKCPGRFLN